MSEFKVQIGDTANQGLLAEKERLETLVKGRNPFNTGHGLPANSGVFFGRAKELYRILAAIRNPEKPASFSLVGENGIGKSSLLNQVYQTLATEADLITIQTSTQNWGQYNADSFFKQLHLSMAGTLDIILEENESSAYANFRNFINYIVKNSDYRFVLLIDDFEKMAENLKFNPSFFGYLRALADNPDYRFGFIIASRRELKDLCRSQKLEESGFWNIFTHHEVLGLLIEEDAQNLLLKPLEQTLTCQFRSPDKLWTQVKSLTGCHPLLIQLTASEFWHANDGHFKSNIIEIKMNLRSFMEDLFYQRSIENQQHWQMLIQAAGGKKLKETSVFYDLYLRGLLLEHGETFSQYFAKVISEECEDKLNKPFEDILNETTIGSEKRSDIVDRLWLSFLSSPKSLSKIEQFSNPQEQEQEKADFLPEFASFR